MKHFLGLLLGVLIVAACAGARADDDDDDGDGDGRTDDCAVTCIDCRLHCHTIACDRQCSGQVAGCCAGYGRKAPDPGSCECR